MHRTHARHLSSATKLRRAGDPLPLEPESAQRSAPAVRKSQTLGSPVVVTQMPRQLVAARKPQFAFRALHGNHGCHLTSSHGDPYSTGGSTTTLGRDGIGGLGRTSRSARVASGV